MILGIFISLLKTENSEINFSKKLKIMDSFNSFSSFNTHSFNVNSWGNVTNNLGQSIGSVDRFGTFCDNLHPDYSYNVDRFGTISNGFNGLGTQFGSINGYDSYQRSVRLRDSMDYLYRKDQDDFYCKKTWKSYEPDYKLPKYEPLIPIMHKYEPAIPKLEPKYSFNSPAPAALFQYEPFRKRTFLEDDYNFRYKF